MMCVCVYVMCVVSVIVKCPLLPPCVVDWRSRNPLYYYYYLRWCFALLVWKDHCLTFFFIVAIFVNSDSRKIYFHTFFKFSTQLLWATVAILKINNSILSSHKNVQVYAIFTKISFIPLVRARSTTCQKVWLISPLTDFIIVYHSSAFLAAKTINFLKVCP